uniref:Myb/SANT-like domain-containing protein n=1 Tax=Chenopodium quinoa TaxID=63459 RepID=A0A803N437_CHEQI
MEEKGVEVTVVAFTTIYDAFFVHIAFNMEGDFEEFDVKIGEATWDRTRRGAVIHVVGYVVDGKYLKDTRRDSVEEQVAKSLYILGHNARNCSLSAFFMRSGETMSRHFHRFLNAIIKMEDQFLKQPNGSEEVSPEVRGDSRFVPYFKDCISALVGTHIRVNVVGPIAYRFQGRKGWEGSASDSRVFKNALSREDKLIISQGKYYLGDAGYMLKTSLITPYRAQMVKKNKSSDGKASTSLRWTLHMDKVFLDALIAKDINGNRVDGQFISKAYENVVKECTEKLNHPFTKEHLKNRLKTIKSNFNDVYDLFNASGWGWNEETELFENVDEVWDNLIEGDIHYTT